MADAGAAQIATMKSGVWEISSCQHHGGALYPPKVVPPLRTPNSFEFIRWIVKDPLLSIPWEAYERSVVFRRWPVPIAHACAPGTVRDVLVTQRQDFSEKPSVQRYVLGPLLGDGILLAEGKHWRWQRDTTAPLFRHAEILNYVPIMARAAQRVLDKWKQEPDPVHMISRDMTQATYEVIAQTILIGGGDELTKASDEHNPGYSRGVPWGVAYGLLRLPDWIPRPGRLAMNRRDILFRQIVGRMIDAQETQNRPNNDLLARLRKARNPENDQQMSRKQLIDNVLTFLLAGHHTTATALTWALYLTACAPEWEAQMLDEIMRVVPEGPIGPEHVNELVVVQQVLKESMRLFPPVPILSRIATRDTELDSQSIPKGTVVNIPVYAIHRHRHVWYEPDRFDPTRFAKENEKSLASCQFLPFGAGPRICTGMAFAMIEATVFLATFVRSMHFDIIADDFLPIPISRVVLIPKGGMPLKVTLRR